MITSLDQLPLTCDIETTAKVLGRSVRDIRRDLAENCMEPRPIPVVGRTREKQRRRWSKFAIEAWLKGGYLEFEQAARREAKKGRHYFGKASAALVRRA